MKKLGLLLTTCAALGLLAWSATALADPTAGPPICPSAGTALSGTYVGNLTVKGDAYVAAGTTLNVIGDLNIAPGACFDAFSTGTVTVGGDVNVRNGAVFALGCSPGAIGPFPPCGTTTTNDVVDGSIIARQPLTMYLTASTIRGDVISNGGGPGATFDPYINFAIKENRIYGDLVVKNWSGAWFGALRNTINGNVTIANTAGVAIGDDGSLDSTEVTDNNILGFLDCRGNNPPAQIGDSGGGPNHVFAWASGECAAPGLTS